MFQRYTEKARRVIFFARYEAGQYGSSHIESEHLLLGLLREDKGLLRSFLGQKVPIESLRKIIEQQIRTGKRISTSAEVPLSTESKRILTVAGEEADRLEDKWIGTEHLLVGMLREDKCLAARVLQELGVQLDSLVVNLTRGTPEPEIVEKGEIKALPLRQMVDAWDTRDAQKFATFFEEEAVFTDVQNNLWIGPVDIEKGVALVFVSAELPTGRGRIEDVHFVTWKFPTALIEVTWGSKEGMQAATSQNLRLIIALSQKLYGWRAVKAHLEKAGSDSPET